MDPRKGLPNDVLDNANLQNEEGFFPRIFGISNEAAVVGGGAALAVALGVARILISRNPK